MLLLLVLIFVQIVSESFPVSSSGHLALALFFMQYFRVDYYSQIEILCGRESFLFLLHVPTIFVLIIFFRQTWLPLLKKMGKRWRLIVKMIAHAIIADTITVLFYMGGIKKIGASFPLCAGFAVTALVLFSMRWVPSHHRILTPTRAIALGAVQGIALLPGISRLASVYTAGRWMGLNPIKAFGVSWMLSFPLMMAAVAGGALKEFLDSSVFWALLNTPAAFFLIACATLLSYAAFYLVDRLSRARLFWVFGIYMILPIVFCFLLMC